MQPPLSARLRMALIMSVFVYPVVTLYLYILMPLTTGWEMWQRSLILVPFMATTIVMLIVPFITRRFGAFIAGKKPVKAAA
ncbi:hypothetical protein [Devosia sp.]|uniref:hypothetical protein n=1 Tax=Devosia sp. TaxID=1871048 RepID=UPI00293110D7|nr:hypothetical protein [Devosia sp.]